MTYSDQRGTFFARRLEGGNLAILHVEDGEPAVRLDANVYPVGSDVSARNEHARGIVLTPSDVAALGIEIEA